jgi:hypothetical protein
MTRRSARLLALGFGLWVLGFGICPSAGAQQMPDPSQVHGRALPAPELPDGTVTVRVVREAIGNNAPGQLVRVTVGGTSRTATTDEQGRAEFPNLTRGGEALAEVTVDGEALRSQPFAVPANGGVRIMLVAGMARAAERKKQEEAAAAAAPPTKGIVTLGGDSRIVMEFNSDTLFAFYLLEIQNEARTRVDVGKPLEFELPAGAGGARLREGSSPLATVEGTHVSIRGPFPSGTTAVQIEFSLRYDNESETYTQTFPVALQRTIVGVEKVGSLSIASPQFASVADLPTENGVYVLGQGGTLAPGTPLALTISGLPTHSPTPRYVALALAVLVIGLGGWLAIDARATRRDRQALIQRRDTLLNELAQLEARHRDGTVPQDRYDKRRQRVLNELEQIYGELDEANAGPQGGGEGVAA